MEALTCLGRIDRLEARVRELENKGGTSLGDPKPDCWPPRTGDTWLGHSADGTVSWYSCINQRATGEKIFLRQNDATFWKIKWDWHGRCDNHTKWVLHWRVDER